MRIRYVLYNGYAIGGTARTVINQANELCAEHDVEIASIYRHREAPALPINPAVRLVPLTELLPDGTPRTGPIPRSRRLAMKTRRLRNPLVHRRDFRFRGWDPAVDIQVLRYFWAASDGILVTTRPGLNLLSAWLAPRRLIRVAQDHRNLAAYHPALRESLVRAYRRFDAVTVLTERDREAYERVLAGSRVRLARIPNAVPAPQGPPAALDANVLVAAGRLSPEKGFDLLLDAFHAVAARHPEWQLWIFGEGPSRTALSAQIESLGLAGRAHLKGMTLHLDGQLAAASVFVLSSRSEGLPMVMLEAMTAGLPTVAFDCPTGPGEVIDHGTSGLLVPPQDTAALAAGICELIENPPKRRAMGAAARKISDRYSSQVVQREWEQLFADLLAARREKNPEPASSTLKRVFARHSSSGLSPSSGSERAVADPDGGSRRR